jgi:antirestriction protein ArdC
LRRKRFTVFNLAQCEGLPEELAIAAPPPVPGLIEPRVEALIKATSIDFRPPAAALPVAEPRCANLSG